MENLENLELIKFPGGRDPELDRCPMYTFRDGKLIPNMGVKKRRDEIIYYDVSNCSPEFKEEHKNQIINSNSLIKKNQFASKILTIIPCDGIYQCLSQEEKREIGTRFITLENKNEEIAVKSALITRIIKSKTLSNLYIMLNFDDLNSDLQNKILPEIVELVKSNNGFYIRSEDLVNTDEYKM